MSQLARQLHSREQPLVVRSGVVTARGPRRLEELPHAVNPGELRAGASEASVLALDAAALVESGASAQVPDTATLFRRYASYVAAIGIRMLGRQEEIEDFVQDVFVSVHRSIGQLRDPGALKGWLAKLAVREAMRRLKRRRLRAFFGFGAAPEYTAIADASASPEERTLLARVFVALDKLPADERVAWSLRYLEGETMESVAALCRCSLSTAKRRVASAEQAMEKQGVGRAG